MKKVLLLFFLSSSLTLKAEENFCNGEDISNVLGSWHYQPAGSRPTEMIISQKDNCNLEIEITWYHSPFDFYISKISGKWLNKSLKYEKAKNIHRIQEINAETYEVVGEKEEILDEYNKGSVNFKNDKIIWQDCNDNGCSENIEFTRGG